MDSWFFNFRRWSTFWNYSVNFFKLESNKSNSKSRRNSQLRIKYSHRQSRRQYSSKKSNYGTVYLTAEPINEVPVCVQITVCIVWGGRLALGISNGVIHSIINSRYAEKYISILEINFAGKRRGGCPSVSFVIKNVVVPWQLGSLASRRRGKGEEKEMQLHENRMTTVSSDFPWSGNRGDIDPSGCLKTLRRRRRDRVRRRDALRLCEFLKNVTFRLHPTHDSVYWQRNIGTRKIASGFFFFFYSLRIDSIVGIRKNEKEINICGEKDFSNWNFTYRENIISVGIGIFNLCFH